MHSVPERLIRFWGISKLKKQHVLCPITGQAVRSQPLPVTAQHQQSVGPTPRALGQLCADAVPTLQIYRWIPVTAVDFCVNSIISSRDSKSLGTTQCHILKWAHLSKEIKYRARKWQDSLGNYYNISNVFCVHIYIVSMPPYLPTLRLLGKTYFILVTGINISSPWMWKGVSTTFKVHPLIAKGLTVRALS